MNYLKRFAILLLPLIMIACNDDDNLNTGTATVEFQSAEIEIKELTSSLNLPIVVKERTYKSPYRNEGQQQWF